MHRASGSTSTDTATQYVANEFYGALFEHVRVIWYEAPEDVDATTLFTRLNVGRIPLTDAELVKALLLSEQPRAARRRPTAPTRSPPSGTASSATCGTRSSGPSSPASATEEPTHISLLLDTLAGGPDGPRAAAVPHLRDPPRRRSTSDPQEFWNEVVELHALVLGWYANRDLFHKIGFLIAERAATFGGSARPRRGQDEERASKLTL